jgi:pyridoxal phosphate enzyme (YggS family)
MTTISNRLQDILATIQSAKATAQALQDIDLLAVSKAHPAAVIREAFKAGQRKFGENYVQEALEKQSELNDLDIEWHFIGPIQSNKTSQIAQHFAWVHGIDRLKIAQRLNDARPADLPPLQVCIQLNISHEATKGGILSQDAYGLAQAIEALPRLKLRGLMAIPAPTADPALQRSQFKQVRECYDALKNAGVELDTLSMGMSEDYPAAIAQGATIVRVGSALFGQRLSTASNL